MNVNAYKRKEGQTARFVINGSAHGSNINRTTKLLACHVSRRIENRASGAKAQFRQA